MAQERSNRWQWLFDFVTMVAVLVGLTFGAIELRQIRAAQETQAVLQLFQASQSPDFVRGSELILELPDDLSVDELREVLRTDDGRLMQQVVLTFEALGVMVYRGDISIEWVDEIFRLVILTSWERFEPVIMEDRARLDYAADMEWHQWLAERLRDRSAGGDPIPAYEAYRDWTDPRK